MEFLIELIIECFFEGVMEASTNKKLPRWLRIICITIIILFLTAVIGFIVFTGLMVLKQNLFIAMFLFAIALFLPIALSIKCKRSYQAKMNE